MGPILRALMKSKAAALLIVLEIALTLAIVSNALSIIFDRIGNMQRPSGIEEDRIVSLQNSPAGPTYDVKAGYAADLARLLAIPGVENAYPGNTLPLSQGGWSSSVTLKPGEDSNVGTAIYFADERTIPTLGLKLIEGRNFDAREVTWFARNDRLNPPVTIVTKALAEAMFPGESAIGKRISVNGEENELGQEIIGVVERLQAPWPRNRIVENSSLVPHRIDGGYRWVIRTAPGMNESVLKAAEEILGKQDRARVIESPETFAAIRAEGYQNERAMVIIMAVISVLLLAITALGIVGMVSFWVTQRTKQIGTRRALGARRSDILNHFRKENLLLSVAGIVIGTGLAFGANYLFANMFGATVMPWFYLPIGALVVLLLGQLAVWVPARRASLVAPAIATRSA